MKFVIIPILGGRCSWELRSRDGTPIGKSPGTFASADAAKAAIRDLRGKCSKAGIYDLLGTSLEDDQLRDALRPAPAAARRHA